MQDIDYSLIEQEGLPNMVGSVRRYIEDGLEPGGFLSAVINNDLKNAFLYADAHNYDKIGFWANWFYTQVPSKCWGSERAMISWIRCGGLNGLKKHREPTTESPWSQDETVSPGLERG
jgi:hypothetical protein